MIDTTVNILEVNMASHTYFTRKTLVIIKEDEYALPISDNEESNLEHDFTIILKGIQMMQCLKPFATLLP